MNGDRLGDVELNRLAPGGEDLPGDIDDQAVLDEGRRVLRADQRPPQPLGRLAVETTLAEGGPCEICLQVVIERLEHPRWKRVGDDAVAVGEQPRSPAIGIGINVAVEWHASLRKSGGNPLVCPGKVGCDDAGRG